MLGGEHVDHAFTGAFFAVKEAAFTAVHHRRAHVLAVERADVVRASMLVSGRDWQSFALAEVLEVLEVVEVLQLGDV